MSLESYSAKGQQEWGNIYQRGAIVAGLLDLEILSRSQGRRGLREVLLELASTYGPDTAFGEAGFFDEITAMWPDDPSLTQSTAAARLNGWVAGYGEREDVLRDIGRLGLSPEAEKRLREGLELED